MNSTLHAYPHMVLESMQKSLQFIIDYKHAKDGDRSNCKKEGRFQRNAYKIYNLSKYSEVALHYYELHNKNRLNAPDSSKIPIEGRSFKRIKNYLLMFDLLSLLSLRGGNHLIKTEDLRRQEWYFQGTGIDNYLEARKEDYDAILRSYLPGRKFTHLAEKGRKKLVTDKKVFKSDLFDSFRSMLFRYVTLIKRNLAKKDIRDHIRDYLSFFLVRSTQKELGSLITSKNVLQEDFSDFSEEFFSHFRNKISFINWKPEKDALERIIENMQHPSKVFPIGDDSLKEIVSYLSVPDLISFKVNRFALKIVNEALTLQAENLGYTQPDPAKHFLEDLKREFRLAVADSCLAPEISMHKKISLLLDEPVVILSAKRVLFDEVVRRFQGSSNSDKFMFLKNTISSSLFKNMRRLIHPSSSKLYLEKHISTDTVSKVIKSREKNLLKFLVDGFVYPDNVSTPLHFAAQMVNLELVKYLFDQDPTAINKPGLHGGTPLCFACGLCEYGQLSQQSSLEVVEYLLAAKADPNLKTSSSKQGKYPLHFAIEMRRKDLVTLLLKNGADINVNDETGVTPLLQAAMLDDQEIIAILNSAIVKK